MDGPGRCDAGSEKSKMLAGELYSAADAQLTAERERCQALLTRLNGTPVGHEDERSRIVRQLFAPIHIVEQSEHQPHSAHGGALPHLEPTFRCDYGYNISFGRHFYANFDCCILDCCAVKIGDDVFFGPRVQVAISS